MRALALPLFGALGTLTLAHGLVRRRRLAWWAAAVALATLLLMATRGHPVRVAAIAVVLAALVVRRADFATTPDPARLRSAARLGAGVIAACAAWWVVIVLLLGRHPGRLPTLLIEVGLLVMLGLALASAQAPEPGTAIQRAAVHTLVNHADADSLAPFATRGDKSYVFSPDGRAAIGYRVVLGTAIAGGDPVGQADQSPGAIAAFLDLCRRRGWRPAALGVTEQGAALWRAQGLRGVVVGDEAVLDVATFSLASRRMRNVRQAVARTHNAGVTVTLSPPTDELVGELAPVLQSWLAGRQLRGFSMNLDQLLGTRPDTVIAVARTADGRAVAFARFANAAAGQTLTLDVAPRRRDAPNGTVERLLVEAVDYARVTGAREVSLNFAGFRRIFESDARLSRVMAGLAHVADPWIGLEPLYRFCAKFHPQWRARSLMLGSWLSLATVGAAAILTELRAGSADERELRPDPPRSNRNGPAARAQRRGARLLRR